MSFGMLRDGAFEETTSKFHARHLLVGYSHCDENFRNLGIHLCSRCDVFVFVIIHWHALDIDQVGGFSLVFIHKKIFKVVSLLLFPTFGLVVFRKMMIELVFIVLSAISQIRACSTSFRGASPEVSGSALQTTQLLRDRSEFKSVACQATNLFLVVQTRTCSNCSLL